MPAFPLRWNPRGGVEELFRLAAQSQELRTEVLAVVE